MNKDSRTLASLLKLEENYTITGNYFNATIKPEMRSKLATWMLEVCEEQECTDEVYATAMNVFDRLMCILHQVEVYHLQLLGSVCLFISSKLSSSHKLNACKLVDYTDNSISLEDLLEWELFVMDKLRWDVCSIVPNEFIDILLEQLNLNTDLVVLKRHCYAFTAMCATDFRFAQYPASMIACACIMNAIEGLNKLGTRNNELSYLASCLNDIANIDTDFLFIVKEQVNDLFKQSSEQSNEEQTNDSAIEESMNEMIQYEDDYDFNIEFNLDLEENYFEALNTKTNQQKMRYCSNNGLAKTLLLSPAPSSPASSSGVSSTSSLHSPSLLNMTGGSSSYYTNQEMISMMMITPPLANSLPMPEFDRFESICTKREHSLRQRTTRQSQRLVRC